MSKFFVRIESITQPQIRGIMEYPDEGIKLQWSADPNSGRVTVEQGEGRGWEQKRDIAMVEIQNELARQGRR